MNSDSVFSDYRGLSPLVHYENWTKLQHEEKKTMGSGRSGIYYTSHGSSYIHHDALIHVMEGEYDPDNGIARWHINGAHGQDFMDFMDKNGIINNVNYAYDNGVRIGKIKKLLSVLQTGWE